MNGNNNVDLPSLTEIHSEEGCSCIHGSIGQVILESMI